MRTNNRHFARSTGWSPSTPEYHDKDYRTQSRGEFERPGYRENPDWQEESDYDQPDNVRSRLQQARARTEREDFRRFENRSYNQPGREYESYDRPRSQRGARRGQKRNEFAGISNDDIIKKRAVRQ